MVEVIGVTDSGRGIVSSALRPLLLLLASKNTQIPVFLSGVASPQNAPMSDNVQQPWS